MSREPELTDEENAVLVAVLRQWVKEHPKGGFRRVGVLLGYDRIHASQQISRVAKDKPTGRIGYDLADRIYGRLGVDRATYLKSKGLAHLIDTWPGHGSRE